VTTSSICRALACHVIDTQFGRLFLELDEVPTIWRAYLAGLGFRVQGLGFRV